MPPRDHPVNVRTLLLFAIALAAGAQGPDWIPVDTISPAERSQLLSFAARLETEDAAFIETTLAGIRVAALENDGDYRRAAVVLLSDLVRRDRHIISRQGRVPVTAASRITALAIIADIGGHDAHESFLEALKNDVDPSVRAYAARRLPAIGSDTQGALSAVSAALRAAIRTGSGEEEILPYLDAIGALLDDPWIVPGSALAEALLALANGPYSARVRRSSSTLLELLLER